MSSTNKPVLKIDWATHEAAKFACVNWHYSKSIPKSKLVKIGAWENDKFIGCVIYSYGATPDLVKPYGLKMNEGCELTRIALTKHDAPVSRIMAISLKMLKKENPGLRIVVSFADSNENHHGGIYQASNYIYSGLSQGCFFYKDKLGKIWHPRNVSENLNLSGKCIKPSQCEKIWKNGKHRYLMPLDAAMREQIAPLAKPYPKRVKQAMAGVQPEQRRSDTDPPAPFTSNVISSEQIAKSLISLQKAA
tara:strand:+ start:1029 stop:1772 length:744 start_codon:yes stop_codon:yes gene_type:complete